MSDDVTELTVASIDIYTHSFPSIAGEISLQFVVKLQKTMEVSSKQIQESLFLPYFDFSELTSTYIKYANTNKPMINNVVYIISTSSLDFFKRFVKRVESRILIRAIPSAGKGAQSEPVDTLEEQPEAAYAAQQANCKTNCKQIHFLSVLDVRHNCCH